MSNKTYTIQRSKWNGMLANVSPENSRLYNPMFSEHNMCCLGIIACQLGYDAETIRYKKEPEDVFPAQLMVNAGFVEYSDVGTRNTILSKDAMRINDDECFTPEHKESKLIALFAEHGHTITFED